MARADVLKRLFEAYVRSDTNSFEEAAMEAINDERRKHHHILANELQGILTAKTDFITINGLDTSYPPVPRDNERGTPLLTVTHADRYFSDLVLDPDAKSLLEKCITEYNAWDVLAANSIPPTTRLLFCGPPGCGKTASAEALATEIGLPLLYVRFDGVVSSLLGETAANINRVFEYASEGSWLVLFDEFDAIGRSRDDPTEHGEIKRVVNSFLQLIDGFMGRSVLVAATNFEQSIDPAIWRRFDEIVFFGPPSEAQLETFIKKQLITYRYDPDLPGSLTELLAGASFADALRVCNDMKKRCILAGDVMIDQKSLDQAIYIYNYRKQVLDRAIPKKRSPVVDKIER